MQNLFKPSLSILAAAGALLASAAPTTVTLQSGTNGFSDQFDVDIRQASPNANFQNYAFNDVAFSDAASTPTSNDAIQSILAFDIFGVFGAPVVPAGSTILGATLTLTTAPESRSGPGQGGTLHRMLVGWYDETETWNSLGNGLSADDVETRATPTDQFGLPNSLLQPGPFSVDVTADVQAWSAGATNFGWAILPFANGTNGWGFLTADSANVASRPLLRVVYQAVPEPASFAAVGVGALGLLRRRRRD